MAESLYEPNTSDLSDEGELREQESDEICEKGVVEQFFSEGCGCHNGSKAVSMLIVYEQGPCCVCKE